MILLDVKKLIRNRIQELNKDYERDPGYDLCKEFVKNNNVGRIEDFMDIDIYDCVKCLYYINNSIGMSMDEVSAFVDSFTDYVEDLDYRDFTDLFDSLFAIGNSRERKYITAYMREESEFSAMKIFKCINFNELRGLVNADMLDWEKTLNLKKIVKGLRQLQRECDAASIIDCAAKDKDALGNVLSLIEVQKKMISDKRKLDVSMDLLSVSSRKKDRNKITAAFYKDYYKPRAILGAVNSIRNFVNSIEKSEATYYRDAKREIRGYESSIALLEAALGNKEITNAREIVKNVKSEEIKMAMLQLIYEHNRGYYKTLMSKYKKLSHSSVNAYISVLNEYNISVSIDTCKGLMSNSLEDFKEILATLSKLELSKDQIIRVLGKTNIDVSRKIKEFIDKGYLLPGFICENLSLFDEGSSNYNALINNMIVLDRYNINPALFKKSPEVFLLDNELFTNNFALLDSYGLIRFLKTTTNLSFIGSGILAGKIDSFIELGLFSLLEQNLNLLNSDNINRLYALRAMNFDLNDIDTVSDILDSNRFMISDSAIIDYIPDILIYKDSVKLDFSLEDLEKYRNDRCSYLIGGVLISSNKVKRLLENGSNMYDAIFKGVFLSDEEYSEMLKSLCPQK